jgi:hypothetical protein
MLLMFGGGWMVGRARIGAAIDRASLTDLERRFAEDLSSVALVGRFTIDGREDGSPAAERYEISTVEKVGPDEWRFNSRMRYGKVDVTLPIVANVFWAGDTPVLTMTNLEIPTLGTFTVRILFYGDRYSGTWQHIGRGGGLMSGRIEKVKS